MKTGMITAIVNALLALLPKDQAKELIDAVFDRVEEIVMDSSNTIDDAIILPIVRKLREVLDIPDIDDK